MKKVEDKPQNQEATANDVKANDATANTKTPKAGTIPQAPVAEAGDMKTPVMVGEGLMKGQLVDMGKGVVKKFWAENDKTITFVFAHGKALDVSQDDFPEDIRTFLLTQGINSVLSDSHAQQQGAENKHFTMVNKLESLRAGRKTINTAGRGKGADLNILRAVCKVRGDQADGPIKSGAGDWRNDVALEVTRSALTAHAEATNSTFEQLLVDLGTNESISVAKSEIALELKKERLGRKAGADGGVGSEAAAALGDLLNVG